MKDGFFRPTKYKLVLFLLISLVMLFSPVVPTLNVPELSIAAASWSMSSAAANLNVVLGSTPKSFGLFAGTEAGVLNILYIMAAGYILACVFLYGYHKIHG